MGGGERDATVVITEKSVRVCVMTREPTKGCAFVCCFQVRSCRTSVVFPPDVYLSSKQRNKLEVEIKTLLKWITAMQFFNFSSKLIIGIFVVNATMFCTDYDLFRSVAG